MMIGGQTVTLRELTAGERMVVDREPAAGLPLTSILLRGHARLILATLCDETTAALFTTMAEVWALPLPVFQECAWLCLGSLYPSSISVVAADIRAYIAAVLALSPLVTVGGVKVKRWTAGELEGRASVWQSDRRDYTSIVILESIFNTDGTALFTDTLAVQAVSLATVEGYKWAIKSVNGPGYLEL